MPGNTFGGSFNSGKPRSPVSYTLNNKSKSYAWDSVSVMAKTFGVDPKLIRVKREQGKVISISQADFDNFTGVKLSEAGAEPLNSKSYFANSKGLRPGF